ncbi:MAG: Eco57I restriction-modification methylase domain-containing protein [Nitrospirae bacterium]|nr:Eco57I restriction-modification methylase domain-containing protein [Nitrospirota bacterium]
MEKQAVARLIKDALQNPFDRERFVYFIKNLLNKIDESKAFHARGYVPEIFKDHVKTYERIGTYTDPEGKKTDILVVYLQKEAALDRARTTQRNFIARYLKDRGEKDAGLIAFVSPYEEDWRFSFVKMEYRLAETPTGRIKAEEEFTPARRYSYLVGKNENSHTAQSRLLPLLIDDKQNPRLNEIEEAFSIEKVTKEFFEKYRDLFMRTKDALDEIIKDNEKVKNDFRQRGVNSVDFSKKLLGQIVFLYFLQKKGWFGVARDAAWGTGPRNFLCLLFEKRLSNYQNFFNDILEPLFYEALAIERQADFYSRFNCKIPFLNGGLFDPINNYDWVHTDVLLPDELFSNDIKTKEGDTGTGILDVFDRYNFTVKEDEPLEKEVAVDPEMLGKVFENLLEVKDRKSKGTYYTPREIVHYMCQESLINYLDNVINTSKEVIAAQKAVQKKLIGEDDPEQLGIMEQKQKTVIPKEDIESFIRHGISAIEHDRRVEAKGRETETYSYRMPDSIRLNARLFDNALKTAKICDPAVGSGAFLVGMMHEIIRARETLTTYIGDSEKRTPYNFKHHAIQDCLYGVDIDQGAVEIAKLRLWLSLMVDEEDIKHIKPLPNLDYKIVCGNSLLGINDLFHHAQLKKLEELKGRFFEETNSKKKSQLKDDIDHLIREITHDDKHFDFKVYFSEVFSRGGFDITIANPPYVRHETIKELKPELKEQFGDFFCGTADIYTYFYHRGLDILKPHGHLCFIAPNKFMRAGYGKNTRILFTTAAALKIVMDFCDLPIFDATTYPSIILLEKRPPLSQDKALAATFTDAAQLERVEETLSLIGFPMPISSLKNEGWNLEQPDVMALMEKLRKAGKPLGEYVQGRFYRGILTGLNEAFVIDAVTRERLISEDPQSKELIKPWLRGRDIKKWKAEWANLYLINIASSANKEWSWSDERSEAKAKKIFKETYPAIHDHLIQWKDKLQKRDDQGKFWWELRSCAYYEEFEQPKIIYPDIAKGPEFTWDESKAFLGNTAYIIPTDEIWLLGLLNSQLIWWLYLHISSTIQGGFVRFIAQYMEQLPIPFATNKQKAPIITLVDRILAVKEKDPNSDTSALEKQIDEMVYALYGLTPEEIAIVKG